jgi:DnaJ-class molecular chaperone
VVEAAARLGALADAEEATDASTDASSSTSAAAAVLGKDDVADRSDLYLVLDLPADFTESELKSRYRRASLSSHPDKPSGSQRAFQRVAEAYQVLGDPEARDLYDLGLGLGEPREDAPGDTTLWEEVEREFFPEVHGWRPFGDPHERKRESAAARARSREFRERYGEL